MLMHKYESVSHSVVSDSLTPLPSPGDLPNPGIKPRFPTLQADPLPAEPQGKPKNTGVGSLSLLQIFLTQESNQGLLHCRRILYQLKPKDTGVGSLSFGDLPDPGIKSGSPALQVDSLPTELSGEIFQNSTLFRSLSLY